MSARSPTWWPALIGLWLASAASMAHAEVHREGDWPDDDEEHVSLKTSGSRTEAIHRLAEAAGWSVVVGDLGPGNVDVDVKDQPAGKVLDLLLSEGEFRVTRDDKLLAISPLPAAGPVQLEDTAKTERDERGEDRVITGSSVVIEQHEVVGDLTVFGGSAEVYGTATGDVTVFGGRLQVRSGARVLGDVNVIGGSGEIDEGAHVEGKVNSVGGRIVRDDSHESAHAAPKQHEDDTDEADFFGKLGGSIARTALVFAFGCLLLSAATRRMALLQHEAAERPIHALALGVVGFAVGVVVLIAMCVTLIGIPVAIISGLVGALSVYAGICASFTALGAQLLRGRSDSPYAHLGLGCFVYFIFASLPVIGWMVTVAAVAIGLGLIVSTRAAGFLRREPPLLTPGE